MIRLVVVSHALVQEAAQARWRQLAERFPVDVTLLVPDVWETVWLGDLQVFRPAKTDAERFRVIPLPVTDRRRWTRYFFRSLDVGLRRLQPDVIYVIHEEMIWIHMQILAYRSLWCPKAKLVFFSMNALGIPQAKWHQRVRWRLTRRGASAALCHYPGCETSLREANFDKTIHVQTQIGVDETDFRPDERKRHMMRRDLDLEGKFVVGYAGRLCREKGVDDLISAFPLDGIDWAFLAVGDGDLTDSIQEAARRGGWEHRLRLTGTVALTEVANYMRAMDCFVLASRTTPGWIDTFPLVVPQAMASGVPVIGSDSGAIPWQIGDAGLVFPEGDRVALRACIQHLADDREKAAALAASGRTRCLRCFSISALTDQFYKFLCDLTGHEPEFREVAVDA